MSNNKPKKKRPDHPISRLHKRAIIKLPPSVRNNLTETWAITARPGDRTDSFLGKAMRPLGAARWIVLRYVHATGKNGCKKVVMPLCGYTTRIEPATARINLGGSANNEFAYDFSLQPWCGAKSRIVDPMRNPSLALIALDMHKLCQRATERRHVLDTQPQLPQYVLGFAAKPEMVDSAPLRQRIADHMGRPRKYVDSLGEEALHPLLQAEWDSVIVPPGQADNDSSLFRIPNQFYPNAKNALRIWEDHSELLGVEIRNPVLDLLDGRYKIANPTRRVAKKAKISLAHDAIDAMDDEKQRELIKLVRDALGVDGDLVSDGDIAGGILAPKEPIVPSAAKDALKEIPDDRLIKVMKRLAGRHADACRESDLLEAARNPGKRLFAAGLERIQPLRKEHCSDPYKIEAPHLIADFGTVQARWDFTNGPAKRTRKGTR